MIREAISVGKIVSRVLSGIAASETVIKPGSTEPGSRQSELIGKISDIKSSISSSESNSGVGKIVIDPINEGEILSGRYEVRELIASGGMADIHLGYDTQEKNLVVIKSLKRDVYKLKTEKRLLREAQATAVLNHTNIVKMLDVGKDKGRTFIVLEYVEGGTLQNLIDKYHAGQIDLNTMLHYFADICRALSEMHERPSALAPNDNMFVHRDLSPVNVMLRSRQTSEKPNRLELVLMDLGLVHKQDASEVLTTKSSFIGTPHFSPYPDIVIHKLLDGRSDLYSLGMMLYYMVVGDQKAPFNTKNKLAINAWHESNEPPDFSGLEKPVPPMLQVLIIKLLEFDPRNRFQKASEVEAWLRSIASTQIPLRQLLTFNPN